MDECSTSVHPEEGDISFAGEIDFLTSFRGRLG
jgi:hypothetical protein